MTDYDFSNLIKLIWSLPTTANKAVGDSIICSQIQKELNQFFGEYFICNDVMYTKNTDKDFFGIIIKPSMRTDDIVNTIFNSDEPSKYQYYSVEFDSQLFDNFNASEDVTHDTMSTSLTGAEICALLLHDINEMSSEKCIESFTAAVDAICVYKGIILDFVKLKLYKKVFTFVMEDTVRCLTSIFCRHTFELEHTANDFIVGYGLEDTFNSATAKLSCAHMNKLMDQIADKCLVLNWYLPLFKDMDSNSRYIIMTFHKGLNYTGSRLEKLSIINALKDLEEITDNEYRRYLSLTESANAKKKLSFFSRIKYNGLKSIEEDMYEYNMRIKNIETENDAILLMRQINNRIDILDDYLKTEDMSKQEEKRWSDTLDKLLKLRSTLSNKEVYSKKMYGLFVDYNALQNMSNNGMMNTYY